MTLANRWLTTDKEAYVTGKKRPFSAKPSLPLTLFADANGVYQNLASIGIGSVIDQGDVCSTSPRVRLQSCCMIQESWQMMGNALLSI